ncbi:MULTISPECIES: NAD(P)H-dependent glycerol-3-phosphate dehydrogenase [unclassified Leptolyngbya]|uniref:NAD(P)H-dependent glycerol-3-phosphate dehydrogenase n=1 Tax=unclassified Leptolyngbya TaxID=2650499 RepID=UPI001684CDD0|nr:NAD(P)H-dependent glycerol-3-phosphate dehydrogenase [Leptolyngbya sp. FACHB-8]MBD2154548.1 NAD(P)H-dependent glycerol-3-phosphate dehydrogenase [Leptolyngbya sp. FACHB-16]
MSSQHPTPQPLTILGAGAWGSVLYELARRAGNSPKLWSRRGSLPMEMALEDAGVILSAVSIKGVPQVAKQIQTLGLDREVILVTATKGLDAETTCAASQIWQEHFPDNPVVVFSGPNLSKEIYQGLPAATVVSSQNPEAAQTVQKMFASDRFRVYTNQDPVGTELGGTLKNVIAIAVGVCDGLQLGTNAKSALITRALAEIIRIGTYLGGEVETFFGLSGLGDLLATCNSPLSRNYQVGFRMAQGATLEQALAAIGETAEGVNTANVLFAIANREGISMPISHQVYLLLNQQITPQQAVEALMERDLKPEA